MTNTNLLSSEQDYSAQSVSTVFLECNPFLKRFLSRFLKHEQDVEDVAQEVYLKAFSAEKGSPIKQPKAFLFSIAKNLAINELNRKARRLTSYIEECQVTELLESAATTENENEADQSVGLYCEAVAALPEKYRRVFLLKKVHGLQHKEIAQRLNISLSSVEKHLRYGVFSCRTYIEQRTG